MTEKFDGLSQTDISSNRRVGNWYSMSHAAGDHQHRGIKGGRTNRRAQIELGETYPADISFLPAPLTGW